jgi:hypothetical protein
VNGGSLSQSKNNLTGVGSLVQARLSRLSSWRSRPKGRSEAIGVAGLRTQSPPLAITLSEIIWANDPKATAT